MNRTFAEATVFVDGLIALYPPGRNIRRFVLPPLTVAREVAARLRATSVLVGAQNMHRAEAGPWTGEVSAAMLIDRGLAMVEIGHPERRRHFGETNETVGLKVAAAVRHGLVPLICVGETSEDEAAGRADAVIAEQVRGALAHVGIMHSGESVGDIPVLLAYEPVWAIGCSGVAADPGYVAARHRGIRRCAGAVPGHAVPCRYGGSVHGDNCGQYAAQPDINGLFIGRSAWDVAGYARIIARADAVRGIPRRS